VQSGSKRNGGLNRAGRHLKIFLCKHITTNTNNIRSREEKITRSYTNSPPPMPPKISGGRCHLNQGLQNVKVNTICKMAEKN